MWDVSLNQNLHCLSPYICKWLTLAYFHFPNIFVTLPIITVPPHMVYIIFPPKIKGDRGWKPLCHRSFSSQRRKTVFPSNCNSFSFSLLLHGGKKSKDKSSINRQKQIKTSPHVPDKYFHFSIANGSTLEPFGSFYSLKRIHC